MINIDPQIIKFLKDDIESYFKGLDQDFIDVIKKKLYEDQPNAKPYLSFDNYGLRVDVNFLVLYGISISLLPIQIQADYCDIVTFENAQSHDYVIDECTEINFNTINATSVCNLAHLFLFSVNEENKKRAKVYLQKIVFYCLDELERKHLTLLN